MERYHITWEYMPHMTRFSACFFALLLSCVAIAQSPALGPATDPPPATPASTDQPAVTSTQSPEIDKFQKIENNWSDSINRHDQYALELVLSPLFVDVAATGDITTRNQQLAQVITAEDKTIFLTQKVITVRMLGDIAVANGTYTLHHKVNSSKVDEKGVFTHVFERLHGGWVCVNSQRTALREDANVKTKKSSTASEPFHIPLFSHSDKSN
jgi:ketosteroid isomerase-like protein